MSRQRVAKENYTPQSPQERTPEERFPIDEAECLFVCVPPLLYRESDRERQMAVPWAPQQLPSAEELSEIVRHLLPRPEVMPLLADAFGEDSVLYQQLEGMFTQQPPGIKEELYSFVEWLNRYGYFFFGAKPIYPEESFSYTDEHEIDLEDLDPSGPNYGRIVAVKIAHAALFGASPHIDPEDSDDPPVD